MATFWRARALAGLSLVVWTQGDHARATPLAQAARAIAEAIGDTELTALSIHMLGLAEYVRLQLDRAESLMEEALELWRKVGTPTNQGMALTVLAGIAYGRGDMETYAGVTDEALTLFRRSGHASGTALSLVLRARLASDRGDDHGAFLDYQEGLRLWPGVGHRWAILQALAGLAEIAVMHHQPEVAATLVGAVDARLADVLAPISPSTSPADRANCQRAITVGTAILGEARFAALRAAGRELPLPEAVAVALAVKVTPSIAPTIPAGARAGLTPRELDVLRLLATGNSDREIAGTLFISLRTVNTHVANILGKLGVSKRRDAANWAREHYILPASTTARHT
jgi:ATP/maltotriose-dependent transcriptional regulator MalT